MLDGETAEGFYARRVAEEIAAGEPELALLASLIASGGTAVDIGANQGLFAYVLAGIANSVHAFEAHPDYAAFARAHLPPRVSVHTVALSNAPGRASFYVPYSDDGMELHYAGNLKNSHAQFQRQKVIETEVATLDSFGLTAVTFIKADVEGSELEVLEGARQTIARDRPVLLLELLSGTYPEPLAITREVCSRYGYGAFIVHGSAVLAAEPIIAGLATNSTWGSAYATRNVLFKPLDGPRPIG